MALFVRTNNLLGTDVCDELLKFAIAFESLFQPTAVGATHNGETKPDIRRFMRIEDIGDFHAIVDQRIAEKISGLTRDSRLPSFAV